MSPGIKFEWTKFKNQEECGHVSRAAPVPSIQPLALAQYSEF